MTPSKHSSVAIVSWSQCCVATDFQVICYCQISPAIGWTVCGRIHQASVCQLYTKLSKRQVLCDSVSRFADGVTALGMPWVCSLSAHEILAIEALLGSNIEASHVYAFQRVIVHGTVMHTLSYSSRIKWSDYTITAVFIHCAKERIVHYTQYTDIMH